VNPADWKVMTGSCPVASPCHLHRDRAHAARTVVDEDRVPSMDAEQPKTAARPTWPG